MTRERFVQIINSIPLNVAIIFLCLIWLLPTLGLLVTSFRPQEAVNTTGWWTAFSTTPTGAKAYDSFCSACHGSDLKGVRR